MIIPDTNLLLYAYDDTSSRHTKARRWCEEIMSGPEPVVLLPVVILGFVRVATHPKILGSPIPIHKAQEHVLSWLALPHVRVVDVVREDVESVLAILGVVGTAGNLTTDAQIAAVAMRLDATVHTADLDFARFRGVKFINPILR